MKPIKIALSGSGFKFPAHIGSIKAILDEGYQPSAYAGTSGGSIIAALLASGMNIDELHILAMTQDWSNMLTYNPILLQFEMGLCNGDTLEDWIDQHTQGKTFADLDIELSIIASDIAGNGEYVFSKATTPNIKISKACRCSASIPFVYTPVQIEESWLMDGGINDNIPLDHLINDDTPTIGIHLVSNLTRLTPGLHTAFTIVPRIVEQMMNATENALVKVAELKGNKVVSVDTSFVSGLDRNMSQDIRQQLYDVGYNSTKQIFK